MISKYPKKPQKSNVFKYNKHTTNKKIPQSFTSQYTKADKIFTKYLLDNLFLIPQKASNENNHHTFVG
jgi:hypothetical protein